MAAAGEEQRDNDGEDVDSSLSDEEEVVQSEREGEGERSREVESSRDALATTRSCSVRQTTTNTTSCARLMTSRQRARALQNLPKARRGADSAWSSTRTSKHDCATSDSRLCSWRLLSTCSVPPLPLSSCRRGEGRGKEHEGGHLMAAAAAAAIEMIPGWMSPLVLGQLDVEPRAGVPLALLPAVMTAGVGHRAGLRRILSSMILALTAVRHAGHPRERRCWHSRRS